MKTVFKAWNFLMIAASVVSLIMIIVAAVGGSALAGSGFLFFMALPVVLPFAFTIIMARAGLRGDYTTATKFGIVVFVLDIINVASNGSKGMFSLFLAAVYVFMAVSLNKYKI